MRRVLPAPPATPFFCFLHRLLLLRPFSSPARLTCLALPRIAAAHPPQSRAVAILPQERERERRGRERRMRERVRDPAPSLACPQAARKKRKERKRGPSPRPRLRPVCQKLRSLPHVGVTDRPRVAPKPFMPRGATPGLAVIRLRPPSRKKGGPPIASAAKSNHPCAAGHRHLGRPAPGRFGAGPGDSCPSSLLSPPPGPLGPPFTVTRPPRRAPRD